MALDATAIVAAQLKRNPLGVRPLELAMSPREGAVRFAAGISLGLAVACSSPVEAGDAFEVEATVSLVAVNGGCWSLIVGDSLSFEPLDLPDEFMQDGLRVHARLKPQTEFGSRCQVGQVMELLGIEALD